MHNLPKVVIIFLCHFTGASIKLNDFFVGHARQEGVRVWGGVEANTMRSLPRSKPSDTFSVFRIPKFHLTVI